MSTPASGTSVGTPAGNPGYGMPTRAERVRITSQRKSERSPLRARATDHTPAERAHLDRIETAQPAPESAVEIVARAIADADEANEWHWQTLTKATRKQYREMAAADVLAMKPGAGR